jgi:hypothetical protein
MIVFSPTTAGIHGLLVCEERFLCEVAASLVDFVDADVIVPTLPERSVKPVKQLLE